MKTALITPGITYAWGHRSLHTMKPVRVLETARYWEHPYEGYTILTPAFPDEPLSSFTRPGGVYRGLLCATSSDEQALAQVVPPLLPLDREEAARQLTEYRLLLLPQAVHLVLIAPNRIVRPWDEHLRVVTEATAHP